MRHDNNFDLLRLFAAAQVMYYHAGHVLSLPKGGPLYSVIVSFPGVACFFILSGFLVTQSWLNSRGVADFFAKRALRIYPALIVNIAVLEAAMLLTGGYLDNINWAKLPGFLFVFFATASQWVAVTASGVQPYALTGFFPGYPSGVLWTLTVELSFYLTLPLVLAVYQWRKPIGWALLAGLMIASWSLAYQFTDQFIAAHPVLNETIPPYFWVFGLGIAARLAWPRLRPLVEGKVLLWAGLYGALTVAVVAAGGHAELNYKYSPNWLVAVRLVALTLLLLSAAFSFRAASRILRGHDLSYALYLYHMLVVYVMLGYGLTGGWYWWPVFFGSSAAIAAVSWVWIERPALRLKGSIQTGTRTFTSPSRSLEPLHVRRDGPAAVPEQ